MKMRILAALLAAVMLLSGSALAADTDAAAPSADSGPAGAPTETMSPTAAGAVAYGDNSIWFDTELAEANDLGLIPSRFEGADLRVTMTRAEFAAVALLVYERMSETTVASPENNPFTDTSDADVLRAYAAGIVNGYADGAYIPGEQVSRQQTATMLTRVYKSVYWPDWTLAGDATYSAHGLDYGGVSLYADDGHIDDYAFASVYFLTKYGVSNGVGGNRFDPDAGCTREEGIVLALRLYKVFG